MEELQKWMLQIAATGYAAILHWIIKGQSEQIANLRREFHRHEVDDAAKYVTRQEMEREFSRLTSSLGKSLDRIETEIRALREEIGQKADKS